jgi:hypothetical protein
MTFVPSNRWFVIPAGRGQNAERENNQRRNRNHRTKRKVRCNNGDLHVARSTPFQADCLICSPAPWRNKAPPPCMALLRSCRPEGHTMWPSGSIPQTLQDRRTNSQLPLRLGGQLSHQIAPINKTVLAIKEPVGRCGYHRICSALPRMSGRIASIASTAAKFGACLPSSDYRFSTIIITSSEKTSRKSQKVTIHIHLGRGGTQ